MEIFVSLVFILSSLGYSDILCDIVCWYWDIVFARFVSSSLEWPCASEFAINNDVNTTHKFRATTRLTPSFGLWLTFARAQCYNQSYCEWNDRWAVRSRELSNTLILCIALYPLCMLLYQFQSITYQDWAFQDPDVMLSGFRAARIKKSVF